MKARKAKVDPVEPRLTGSLPSWFTTNRVHGHTRLILSQWPHDSPHFARAAAGFKALGAHVFTRHAKTGDEDPWWLTRRPIPLCVQDVIENAHAEGLRIVRLLLAHVSRRVWKTDPGWVCRTRGRHADRTHQSEEFIWTSRGRYREVVLAPGCAIWPAMGADGSCSSISGTSRPGVAGDRRSRKRGQAETDGAPPPTQRRRIRSTSVPGFQGRENRGNIRATGATEVKPQHPERPLHRQHNHGPGVDRPRNDHAAGWLRRFRQERVPARPEPEFSKSVFEGNPDLEPSDHVRQALGWTVLRDAADGRPPHIWVSGVPNERARPGIRR